MIETHCVILSLDSDSQMVGTVPVAQGLPNADILGAVCVESVTNQPRGEVTGTLLHQDKPHWVLESDSRL